MRRLLLLAMFSCSACGDTGQPIVQPSLYVVGKEASAQTIGAWEVKLQVAQVAFGPLKVCASTSASDELCPAALAEYEDSVGAIDLLSSKPRLLGALQGFVGTPRSVAYGYAYTWLTTQSAPRPTSHALAGHSAHLEGSATQTASKRTLRFVADVDVIPVARGSYAVTSGIDPGVLDGHTRRVDIAFDPNAWLVQIDFDELATSAEDPVRITLGSRAHNALVVGITSLAPPRFTWSAVP